MRRQDRARVGHTGRGINWRIVPYLSFADGMPPVGCPPPPNPTKLIGYTTGRWYRVVLEVWGGKWALTVYDDGAAQVGNMTGAMPSTHAGYR